MSHTLVFNFPETIFVSQNSPEMQIDHVLSEAFEVMEAISPEATEEEMADLTQALETYWRIRVKIDGEEHVKGILARVVRKNGNRGYYPGGMP